MLTFHRYGVGTSPSGPRYLLFLPLLLLALLVSACAPLTRGLGGKDVVSSARPPMVVRPAAGFDLLGSGVASPVLDTELGLRHADVGWAFYADAARERQLAVVLSETPDGWQWELDVSSPWREVRRDVYATGPARFVGATFLMPASADPFSLMLPAPPTLHAAFPCPPLIGCLDPVALGIPPVLEATEPLCRSKGRQVVHAHPRLRSTYTRHRA